MGVTAFGKILRKRRIDSSEILGDMAKRLDVSAAYLSSIENGLREIPDSFVEKILIYAFIFLKGPDFAGDLRGW